MTEQNVHEDPHATTPDTGAEDAAAHPRGGFGTRAVHAGQHLDEVFGAVVPPIHLSSTYAPTAVGELRRGYDYGRGTNPTRDALQEQLAALEAGVDESGAPRATGLTFASGLAAETALIMGAGRPGMTIVLGNDVYGGSYRLISRVLAPGAWSTSSWTWGTPSRSPPPSSAPPPRGRSWCGWRPRPTR